MKRTLATVFAALLLTGQAAASQCYLSLVKDSCWLKYNVTVKVFTVGSEKLLATVMIPTGSTTGRQAFECKPAQKLRFEASFNPVFWQDDQGKTYSGHKYWTLPEKEENAKGVWDIKICYPDQFQEVPMPPEAGNHCACNMQALPELKVE